MMQIVLNGQSRTLEQACTVDELLAFLDIKGRLAVEINQQIVPRSQFQSRKINPGDTVEVVHAIGGG